MADGHFSDQDRCEYQLSEQGEVCRFVIASEAKQSRGQRATLDRFVAALLAMTTGY